MSIKKSFEEILLTIDPQKKHINQEVFQNTPTRMEEFYTDFFSGLKVDPYKFLENSLPANGNDLIIEKNIPFYSMCEHHILPFFGKISIGYIPKNKIIGFGDIVKVVEAYSKRPQLQERLIEDIASTLFDGLDLLGVYIIIEAEHLCMTMRGVKKPGTKVITSCAKGIFKTDTYKVNEFLGLLNMLDNNKI